VNNKIVIHHPSTQNFKQFENMLHDAGIVMLQCDMNGKVYSCEQTKDQWLENILISSPLLLRAIEKQCGLWEHAEGRLPVEAFPGVWIVPTRCIDNGSCNGYAVGVIVTDELLNGGYLNALCQATSADTEVVKKMIQSLPPVATKDVPRLGVLFQFAFSTCTTRIADLETIEAIGHELTDSYEEISLLYTITGSMNSMSKPDRFFELTCNELLQTMPYNWIAIQLSNMDKLLQQESDVYVVGKQDHSIMELSNVIRDATSDITPTATIIAGGRRGSIAGLDDATIIVPIVSTGKVIGVLIAGHKVGRDTMASSVDIKLLSATASQLANFIENALLYDDLNATFIGTLEALTSSIDAKDPYTAGHSLRVALLTSELARAAGLTEEQVNRFHISGLVHDIGKIGVPECVLLKEGRLTESEFDKIRMHPEIGAKILKDIPHLGDVIEGVMHHHERFEGGGYPHGIAGYDIPLVARMIALADTFDAMSSSRTYRAAMNRKTVLAEIRNVTGTQFDPELSALFLGLDFSRWEQLMLEHQVRAPISSKRKAA